MKYLKIVLVILVILINLAFVSPAWADKPKLDKSPDYLQVTKSLSGLQTSDNIPEDVQRQIDELQFQKKAMEAGMTWGQCRNETGQTLAIYGPASKKAKSASEIYFLGDGQSTPEEWDCAGIYLPSDAKVAGLDKTGAIALKILDGTQLSVSKNPETNELVLNILPAEIVSTDQVDWFVPNVSGAFVNSRIPSVLNGDD